MMAYYYRKQEDMKVSFVFLALFISLVLPDFEGFQVLLSNCNRNFTFIFLLATKGSYYGDPQLKFLNF